MERKLDTIDLDNASRHANPAIVAAAEALDTARSETDDALATLRRHAAALADRLTGLVDDIDRDVNFIVNRSGEVQGRGTTIDLACAELYVCQRSELRLERSLIDALNRPAV